MEVASGWASRESRARVGRWLLALTIFTSALCLGALHTPVLAACAVLAALGTGLVWYDGEALEPRPSATVLVVVGTVLVLWTALQLVPLPSSLLASIAHENADVWSRSLSPLREPGPASASISLDPTASRVQVLRGVVYLTVFVGALRVARRQEGIVFLERTLVASSVIVAAAALLHPVFEAQKVFGLYEPSEPYGYRLHHIAPLLNVNHLAAYVDIGASLALASAIQRREALPRPLAIVVVTLLAATTFWTMSRAGIATMFLGALLVVTLTFGVRRTRQVRATGHLVVAFAVIGGAAVLLFSSFDGSRSKFAQNDLSKIDLVKNSFELACEFPLFGLGRGAFESVFPKVRTGTGYWVFTHPENVLAQWATEWGAPVAILAILAIAWALQPRTVLARSRPPVGPWAALVAVAMHNLADFNAEVPGVVVALAVCAAIVTGGTGGGRPAPHRASGWTRRPNVLVLGSTVATLLAVAVTLPFHTHELYNEQRSFRDVGLDRALSRAAFRDRAREAMLRHPAEPYFPFVGAVRATMMRDESVLPWAARALERSPVYGRVHLLLARSLFGRNPSQARLEYRIACEQDRSLCSMPESFGLVRTYEEAMELVPGGAAGVPVLAHLAARLGDRLPATVARLDQELSKRDPAALAPVKRIAARALGDVLDKEVWCAESSGSAVVARGAPPSSAEVKDDASIDCVSDGIAAAGRLRSFAPELCDGHALTAELRVAVGEVDAGFAELERAIEGVTRRSECARRLVSLAVRTGNGVRIDAALTRLIKLGCEAPVECVTNLTFAASVETQRGSHRRALVLLRKAWERAPERDDLLVDIGRRAESQKLYGEALDAYTKLVERQSGDARWPDAVARVRAAATRNVLDRR